MTQNRVNLWTFSDWSTSLSVHLYLHRLPFQVPPTLPSRVRASPQRLEPCYRPGLPCSRAGPPPVRRRSEGLERFDRGRLLQPQSRGPPRSAPRVHLALRGGSGWEEVPDELMHVRPGTRSLLRGHRGGEKRGRVREPPAAPCALQRQTPTYQVFVHGWRQKRRVTPPVSRETTF